MEYGLIGEKLGHSFSKVIHEQLVSDYTYELKEIAKTDIDTFMKEKQFKAINVTIPYKQTVIPYLDEIDESAKRIGAVNTIVNRNGKLIGYNTDYLGFAYTLRKHNISLQGKKVLIMGNGGASKAIQEVVHQANAKQVLIVDVIASEQTIPLSEIYKQHLDCEVIIQTTPVGMSPHLDASPIQLDGFNNLEACVDVIYNPLRTSFLLEAKTHQIPCVNGLEMLVAQAKYAVEYFKDMQIDDQYIDRIYQDLLREQSNLVFIGMPSSGKTTIANEVCTHLKREVVDIDATIVERIQMPISKYFELHGEAKFRAIETQVTKELANSHNLVISCGGGIVKNKENMKYLQHNGFIVYIDRHIDQLLSDPSRPLSSSKEAIQELYDTRAPLYERYSDATICNHDILADAIDQAIDTYINNITMINT